MVEPPEIAGVETEPIEQLERSGPLATALPPALLILPDPETRLPLDRPLVGREPIERLVTAASAAGFANVYIAPGVRLSPDAGDPIATGERLDTPALVVYESSVVHPKLLDLMVAHPLEQDERFTLYDEAGRPAAAFVGELHVVPSLMPITEELPWPEDLGPRDVVRVLYDEDRERAEALVLRSEGIVVEDGSTWRRRIELRSLRVVANSKRPLPQLELLALAVAISSLPLALWGTHLGLVLAAAALLIGVHGSQLVPLCRSLRSADAGDGAEGPLCAATRPLGQAALTGGLTYVIVAPTDRSGVAATVLLAAGAAAALLCLIQARLLLRGRAADVFALPDAHAVAARLGVRWPSALDGSPFVELLVLLAALPGVAELPWSVLAAAAVARLWRWFAGGSIPIGAALTGRPPPATSGE